jgi:hypothetical protein
MKGRQVHVNGLVYRESKTGMQWNREYSVEDRSAAMKCHTQCTNGSLSANKVYRKKKACTA